MNNEVTVEELTKMKGFMQTNKPFRDYVAKDMIQYNRSVNEVLNSPITRDYYKSLLPDGCNYKKEGH